MVHGSCLCGGIEYEITAAIDEIHHCHCSMCRKAHGAAFSSFGRIAKTAFRLTKGSDLMHAYRSSGPVVRTFCSRCGSNVLFSFDPLPDLLWITIGTLNDDPIVRPDAHIFVKSKAVWFDITDQLHQYEEYPPTSGS